MASSIVGILVGESEGTIGGRVVGLIVGDLVGSLGVFITKLEGLLDGSEDADGVVTVGTT